MTVVSHTPENYQIGQDVWLYAGEEDADGRPVMSGGVVVGTFKPFCSTLWYYVIRLNNPEWPIYETRDGYMLSPAADREPLYVATRAAQDGKVPPANAMLGIEPWRGKDRE